jgi:hypothetical protein
VRDELAGVPEERTAAPSERERLPNTFLSFGAFLLVSAIKPQCGGGPHVIARRPS